MATERGMRTAMQAYIDRFNDSDGPGLAALFADDARIEDPVGGPTIVQGRDQIDAFYRGAVEVVDRLQLSAPIRASYAASAAMAFEIHMHQDGTPVRTAVIDVMQFDDSDLIIDMKAYHGPGDTRPSDKMTN